MKVVMRKVIVLLLLLFLLFALQAAVFADEGYSAAEGNGVPSEMWEGVHGEWHCE